jgi:hypothetical protein
MLNRMAQSRRTYKGERDQILAPIASVVYTDLDHCAAHHKTSISQLAADLLAIATSHAELVRELHQATLLPAHSASSADVAARIANPHSDICRRTKLRVPRPVYADIRESAAKYATDAGQIAADLLAIATGHFEAVRHLNRKELLLAM